jgi:hypothetical protein
MMVMNRFKRFNLLFFFVGAELLASFGLSADVYRVSEVLKITSPVSFECRLVNFPHAGQARFQVFLKNASPGSEHSEAEGVNALREILLSAETIELRNVTVRNYFRIDADVWAASRNIRPALAAGRFLRETGLDTTQAHPEKAPLSAARVPEKRVTTGRPEMVVGAYDLQSLLKARIDASSLRAETPLIEALELISGSLEPRLPVVVFWSDLQSNAFVDRDTPIGVDGFGIMPAAQALDIVLYSVSGSGMPLKFTIDGGVLKIGTLRSLSGKVTRVYSLTDLLLPRADFDEDYGSGTNRMGRGSGNTGGRY